MSSSFLIHRIFHQFLVPLMIFVSVSHGFSNETDRLALLDIKQSFSPGLSFWNESAHFCQWQGVVCGNTHQRVIGLELDSQALVGSLHPSIGNLTFLRRINFGYNKLGGNIPKEIGYLPRIQYLNFTDNLLIGEIPVELMNCSDLQVIHFGSNNLTGNIPFEVRKLSKLRSLILNSNGLSGSIPSSVGYLSELQHLWLPGNKLTGTVSSFIGNMSSLLLLSLGSNFIEGELPYDIGNLKNLTRLRLYDNRFSGTVPASLYNLSSAIEISIADNDLYGEFIPTSAVLNVPNLISLIVGYNQFSGSIPAALLNISTLSVFDAPSNNLTGQVPSNVGILKNLRRFNLEFNQLGFGTLGDLDFLLSLSNASFLSLLGLESNQFGGELPASFFNSATQLTRLTLGSNRISGSIPDTIGNLVNLIQLGMENNELEGVIPETVGNLVNSEKLDFNGNRITGSIPESVGNLISLFFLSFADNDLEGVIPLSLRKCTLMQNLLLSQNRLSGEIPKDFINHFYQLIDLDLHQNFVTGSIPSEIGNLKNLGDLSLFDNKFTGEIPSQLGDCTGLEFLDMSGNLLEGSIPSSLGNLKALQFLDISRNNLSGRIPTELETLGVLWHLNLSFNHFEGQVPVGGVFGNYSGFLFEENGKLCGGISELHLLSCSGRSQKRLSTLVIIIVSLSCAGVLALAVACLFLYRRRNVTRESSLTTPDENGLLRVSYKDLYIATAGFSSSNIIGTGSFGSVYSGVLFKEQKPVAVKVLNLQTHGAAKAFQAECTSLGTIRHRNLLKILTICSSIDYKGNEFLALVYELMPNGNLENLLHDSESLPFTQRLDIAIDIASALDYLHNGCEAPIVHCDLKPSNVLLDQNMVAHVGDFGLARVLFEGSGSSLTDQSSSYVVKGSIGYIPPEYGMGANVSPQGDMYSFGILLLELITGIRPTSDAFNDGTGLHEYVKNALPDRAKEVVALRCLMEFEGDGDDGKKAKDEKWKCLVSMLEFGIACSEKSPGERRVISDVLNALIMMKTRISSTYTGGHMNRMGDVLAFRDDDDVAVG